MNFCSQTAMAQRGALAAPPPADACTTSQKAPAFFGGMLIGGFLLWVWSSIAYESSSRRA